MKSLFALALASFISLSAQAYSPTKGRMTPRARPTSPAGGPVVYYGGPILPSVKVYAVFWGKKVDANVKSKIGTFYDALVNSDYIDMLKQYSTKDQTIARGSFGGNFTITPAHTSTSLKQEEVEAELIAQFDAGKLPKPDSNSLYMIHFPPGIKIFAFGAYSCQGWCGDHEAIKNNPKYGYVPYAMIPDQGGACAFGCYSNGTPLSSESIVSSHEIAEAITDPVSPAANEPNAFPAGWLAPSQSEIGDLCVAQASTLTTSSTKYVVQAEWDNSINGCKTGPFKSSK